MSFNLEVAIKAWRGMLERKKVILAEDLEELECHLRDHTMHLVQQGFPEEEAFKKASMEAGAIGSLDQAYKGVFWRKLRHRKLLRHALANQLSMLKNYLLLAIRNLKRYKGYSLLNISGLAVGLACSFFIFLWIQNERSIDQFHENGHRLYQLKVNVSSGDRISTWTNVPFPLAEALRSNYPEIEQSILTLPMRATLKLKEQMSYENGYFASPGFFDTFTFPLLSGNPSDVLSDPLAIVISESVAEKYFGSDWQSRINILDQTLTLDSWQSNGGVLGQAIVISTPKDFKITGVFKETPRNATLQFDVILPVSEVAQQYPHVQAWGPRWFELALLLKQDVKADAFSQKIKPLLSAYMDDVEEQDLILQKYGDAYLHGVFENGQPAGGRIQQIYLVGLVGLALLLIACINFTNLVTARSSQRIREIGVRKALGATPAYLMQQFLGEAILTALLAFLCALGLMKITLPLFNEISGSAIMITSLTINDWLSFLIIALITGIVAGGYPAFYLASQNVAGVFRSQVASRNNNTARIRKGLVIFQFGISAFLIIGTLTVYQQLTYLQTKELGLNKDNVLTVRLDRDFGDRYEAAYQGLLQGRGIEKVTRSSAHPLKVATKNANVTWAGKEPDASILFSVLRTDDQFATTMGLTLLAGRFFDSERDRETPRYIVNETAVRAMGLTNPVGHPFAFGYDIDETNNGQIVGVVKDFHTASLAKEEIGPLIFRYEPEGANFLLIRVTPGKTKEAIAALKDTHAKFSPGSMLDYAFLDDTYQAYYKETAILGSLSRIFAILAVFIACLGIWGLSTFSVQQRTKEIGVRKVLGATDRAVVFILSKDFFKPVVLALIIAVPAAYWAMDVWLTSFAYRVEFSLETVIIAAVLSLSVVMLTIGYQAHRAIRLDPVQSLRHE